MLDDVRAELVARSGTATTEPAPDLLDEVRTAFTDEATDIVADEELDLPEAKPIRSAGGLRGGPTGDTEEASSDESTGPHDRDSQREPVRVRHRFDRRSEEREAARRLVFLRDRRRGRPPSGHGPHGSDPPA